MLAIQDIGDWIQGIVVLIIIAGSALSGLAKAISAKLNRSRMEVEAERERQQRPSPPRTMDSSPPPTARPMSLPRPQPPVFQRRVAKSFTPSPSQPRAELPRSLPPMVKTFLEAVLNTEIEAPPTPRQTVAQPPPPPHPARTKPPKPAVKRRSIEAREEQKAELLEKRIGHVQTHVAPTAVADMDAGLFERPSPRELRRAIILNEILSPPLALRPPA
jgi:hypothetical protein